jgi:hypothetical protein
MFTQLLMACPLHRTQYAATPRAIVMRAGELTKMIREDEGRRPLTSARFAAVLVGISEKVQTGLAHILKTEGFELVGVASTTDELAAISLRDDRPLLVIIDSTDAAKAIEVIKDFHPAARIAVLVEGVQIGGLVPLFQVGAHVCLDRRADPNIIRKSLELVMKG